MRRALIAAIRLYQVTLSPMISNACRFQPTCSNYGIEAIKTHGALIGSYLTIKRLLRCQPMCEGGYDPVPEPKYKHAHEATEDESIKSSEHASNMNNDIAHKHCKDC